MKKVVLVLVLLIGASSWALADDTTHAVMGGFVKSISWADPLKGTKSEIVVKDTSGKITHILISSTTTLWDADAKAIMPDKIIVHGRVNVIYRTTPEGINVGKSIKLLK